MIAFVSLTTKKGNYYMRPTFEPIYNRYLYIIKNPLWLKLLYAFGILSWSLTIFAFTKFLNLNVAYWLIFGPVLAVLTIYHFLNYGINLFYKTFDIAKHNLQVEKYWKSKKKIPLVNIFLPTCGENPEMIEQTFAAVSAIKYDNKKIYVLDDAGDNVIKELALKFKFSYLSRPNKQVMKKAGNLLYGFKRSKGDFYAVFDADFAPNADFLHELLPYMQDKKIGIVQSPQYFEINDEIHSRSPIEYGAANIQEDFYRIIQQSRNSFGGAICVGSNALYRRSAIAKIGGPTQVDHGEDVHTGIDVISNGYKIEYIPLILARGYSPNTIQALYKQHNRWCSSSTGILLSGKVLRAKITVAQKICYYTGFLYYISQLFYFILPIQLFILLGIHGDTIHIINALPFFPHIIFGLFLLPLARITKPKLGTYLATITTIYTHTLTVILRLFGRAATWVPTNTVENGIEKGFEYLNTFSQVFLTSYLLGVSLLALNWNIPLLNWTYYSVIFWLIWNIWLHGLYFVSTYKVIYLKKQADSNNDSCSNQNFNFWRIKTIGGLLASVLIIAISFATGIKQTNGQMLVASKNAILSPQQDQLAISEQKKIENNKQLPKPVQQFNYVVKKGNSLTKLARQAVSEYETYNNIKLDDVEKIYIETYIVKNHLTNKYLEVGDVVTFPINEIESITKNSKKISATARTNWNKYSKKVSFK